MLSDSGLCVTVAYNVVKAIGLDYIMLGEITVLENLDGIASTLYVDYVSCSLFGNSDLVNAGDYIERGFDELSIECSYDLLNTTIDPFTNLIE